MRKIEVLTDSHTEFELGHTRGGSQEGGNSTVTDRGDSGQNRARIERSESEMDTEG